MLRDAFVEYHERYLELTHKASRCFLERDWAGHQQDTKDRLNLHKRLVFNVVDAARLVLSENDPEARTVWIGARRRYVDLVSERMDLELAETFYNSVTRRLFHIIGIDEDLEFLWLGPTKLPADDGTRGEYRQFPVESTVTDCLREIFEHSPLASSFADIDGDASKVAGRVSTLLEEIWDGHLDAIDILRPIFYRNKGAYIVGRLRLGDASSDASRQRVWPLALPLAMSASGEAYVDTLICDEDELSIVFSFTRAYFMVRSHYPFGLVHFLNELLPNKKRSELYAAIGQHKHGKTEFHRGFLEHLRQSSDTFVAAPGIKGMVMTVFTLPSYQTVFKVIRDEFPPQKAVTADEVRKKYHIVKRHDRAGRMADTQEFKDLRLPLHRFDPELIDELRAAAPSALHIEDGQLRIRHLYTERAMTPLNLYIENADRAILTEALDEYGNAIKQLAAANIFPGDMLLKNFGVTRHRRVVFYDYDEISFLTDINFRAVPEPRTPEEEMAAEPWYSVGSNDVFPEEFRRFLFGKPEIKRLFAALHGDLFTPEYWRGLQQAITDGHAMDVFPYRRKRRFSNQRRDVDSPAQK